MAVPIYQGLDFYVPTFEVKLRGSALPRDVIRDVAQVQYRDSVDDIDSFELTINNWDADKREFKYSDKDLFDPGKEVEVQMGYYGGAGLTRMLSGEITSLRPSFPASGQPTLAVSGLNLLHRFRRRQETHVYEKKTDAQIAQEIAGRLGVPIEAKGGGEAYEYVLQRNSYDIVFLMERARRIGYDLFVKEEQGQAKLFFQPSTDVRQVTYELVYGKSLIQFQPNLSTVNQVNRVTLRGWSQTRGERIEASVSRSEITSQNVGSEVQDSFSEREEVITDQPVETEQEARTLARERLERIAKDLLTASGSSVGLPELRAGALLEIKGVGKRFSGAYFVTSTTHSIADGGYTTQFECRREGK